MSIHQLTNFQRILTIINLTTGTCMKYRSPLKVALFTIFSFGIYILFWYVKTKGELNARGGEIPTAWIWLIPIFGYFYWIYKYSEAVDKVTNQKLSLPLAFILVWLIGGGIGEAILQDTYNKLGEDTHSVSNDPK